MKSLVSYWPLKSAGTSLVIGIDSEFTGLNSHKHLQKRVEHYQRYFGKSTSGTSALNIVDKAFDKDVYRNKPPYRHQLSIFNADIFTSPESGYVGIVDTDCLFIITVCDQDDFFDEGGKPIINAHLGMSENKFWEEVPPLARNG